MLPRRSSLAAALAVLIGTSAATNTAIAQSDDAPKLNFADDASKIFQARCNSCHNADKASGGLNLTTYATLMVGGGSGAVIEPGNPDDSWLFLLVNHDESPEMPPNAPKMPDEELDVLRSWIEAGAPETSGSVVNVQKKKKMEFQLDPSALGKPTGEPAMPQGLPTEPVLVNDRPGAIVSLAASPWAPLVAIGQTRQILLYDTKNQALAAVFPFPEGDVHSLRFSRDGDLLIAGGGRGGQSGRAIVFDVKTGERLIEAGQEYDLVLSADLSPDRSLIALGGPSKVLRVYSTDDDSLVYESRKHTEWVTSVSFSPDGVLLASADRNGGTLVWEARTGREFHVLPGHGDMVTSMDWRLDSNVLVSASQDASVKTWDMFSGNQLKTFNAHGGGTTSVRFAKDGRIVTSGRDRVAKLWDQDGKELKAFGGFNDLTLQAAFDHEDKTILTGTFDGVVRLFNAEDASPLGDLRANPLTVASRLEAVRPEADAARAAADAATTEIEPLRQAATTTAEALAALEAQLPEAEAAATTTAEAVTQAEAVALEADTAYNAALATFTAAADADAAALAALAEATQAAAEAAEATRALVQQAAADPATLPEAEKSLTSRTAATQSVVPALASVIASADALTAARPALADALATKRVTDAALADARTASQAAATTLATLQASVAESRATAEAAAAALAEKAPAVDALVATAERLEAQRDALLAELDAREPAAIEAASADEE